MTANRILPSQSLETPALQVHAMNDLRFIREMMERSASFTAVPGWGMAGVGCTALAAAFAASHVSEIETWLVIWLIEAAAAFFIGILAMSYKAWSAQVSLFSGAGGRFMLNLFVPILAGIPLTLVLFQHNEIGVLPSLWLLLYGIGIFTGGAFAVRTVPVMGACFILTGIVSLFLPQAWANVTLAFGFGGLHILFGGIIAWRHGG
jgi:hypothetical protein